MRMIGNEVHIQRGETWSLDFSVRNKDGHPYPILKNWDTPYIAITVTAALYEQEGDYRETHWLDLSNRYIQRADGTYVLTPLKRFTSTEVLYLPDEFSTNEVMSYYGQDNGGKLVIDKDNDFDITNFLFFRDPQKNGNYEYKYIKSYTTNSSGDIIDEEWESYNLRVVDSFITRDWMEQGYLFDVKLLAGMSLQEYLMGILLGQGVMTKTGDWNNEDWDVYISQIIDPALREKVERLYDEGAPLLPTFDTKSVILEPTPLFVSVNLQGGVK